MTTRLKPLATLALLLALAACATHTAGTVKASAPGFLFGLVQGFIAPVTFLLSLFYPDVAVYQVPNNGHFYDLGFVLGIGGFGGLGLGAGRRRW